MFSRWLHRRDRLRAAAWFATWAFMVQVLLPFAQGIPVARADGPTYLVICKAFGPPEILPLGDPPPPPGERADLSDCPVCTSLAFGAALLVPETDFPAVSPQEVAEPMARAETPKSSPRGARPPVRGPPSLV
ncbi:hypothetical protein JCM17960_11340 [Magnetospira thiophila]